MACGQCCSGIRRKVEVVVMVLLVVMTPSIQDATASGGGGGGGDVVVGAASTNQYYNNNPGGGGGDVVGAASTNQYYNNNPGGGGGGDVVGAASTNQYYNNNLGGGGGGGGSGALSLEEALSLSVPGVPGQDYPVLTQVPDTGFTCDGRLPGYYADTTPEVGCQAFHICEQGNRMHTFLCPAGTIFNQRYFVCDWWYNFDCFNAEQFFQLNEEIGKVGGSGDGGGEQGYYQK